MSPGAALRFPAFLATALAGVAEPAQLALQRAQVGAAVGAAGSLAGAVDLALADHPPQHAPAARRGTAAQQVVVGLVGGQRAAYVALQAAEAPVGPQVRVAVAAHRVGERARDRLQMTAAEAPDLDGEARLGERRVEECEALVARAELRPFAPIDV